MGAGGFRGPRSPGRAHPHTCPTAARARGASQGRSSRESPGPRSWAPALPPRDRRRASGYLPLPPAAPFPPLPGGVVRTGQDVHLGLEAGPTGRRGTRATATTTAMRLSSQRVSPAPRAGTPGPLCSRPPRENDAAGAQRGGLPVQQLLTGSGLLPLRRRSPQPPRLPALTDARRKVPGTLRAPPQAASRGRARAVPGQPGSCSLRASASLPSAARCPQAGGWPFFLVLPPSLCKAHLCFQLIHVGLPQ